MSGCFTGVKSVHPLLSRPVIGLRRRGSRRALSGPSAAVAVTPGPGSASASRAGATPWSKVMVIPEENEKASSIIGSPDAPYINSLATTYGNATDMQAGYPTACPSLAAYIIITSGDQQGICDDKPPRKHQLTSDNIFAQLDSAGLTWRQYAESMTSNCQRKDGPPGTYLVRHAPPPYYPSERKRCRSWDVPMGTTSAGALHDDLVSGLPDYSIVTANSCHEMHGSSVCPSGLVQARRRVAVQLDAADHRLQRLPERPAGRDPDLGRRHSLEQPHPDPGDQQRDPRRQLGHGVLPLLNPAHHRGGARPPLHRLRRHGRVLPGGLRLSAG